MRLQEITWSLAAVGQPGSHLQEVGGVKVVEYATALEWAMHVAGHADEWYDRKF